MIKPEDHPREKERLAELESYSILDSLPEEDYDNLTAIAAEICGTPISLVSLLDNKRQWFKSKIGLGAPETPKEYAFCAHAINHNDDIFIVQDSRTDERFHDNPLVIGEPRVIFYAGIPLHTENGLPLGTLCVIDHKPNLLSQNQIKSLKALSKQVINLLKLRKNKMLLEKSISELEEKNTELERFAYIAAHDLKSPLNTINSTAELFAESYRHSIDKEGKKMLGFIANATTKLKSLIDGLLNYSKSETVLKEGSTKINIEDLRDDINGLFSYDNALDLKINTSIENITTNRAALNQILINLVSNAIKYNDKPKAIITIGLNEDNDYYYFEVADNGPGIAEENQNKIFEIFKVIASTDKFGDAGNGIGLATVKKIIEKMDGTISLKSELGKGSVFCFNLRKTKNMNEVSKVA